MTLDGNGLEYVDRLLADTRDELNRADGKASIMLAGLGVIAGVVGGALFDRSWSPFNLDSPWYLLWWAGTLAFVVSVTLLGIAVKPRMRHQKDRERVRYFGHVAQFESFNDFQRAFSEVSTDVLTRQLDQVFHVSRIVYRKYMLTSAAMIFAGIAALLISASLVGAASF